VKVEEDEERRKGEDRRCVVWPCGWKSLEKKKKPEGGVKVIREK
jgi:hypothetical protein